jgi:hypothetical protein
MHYYGRHSLCSSAQFDQRTSSWLITIFTNPSQTGLTNCLGKGRERTRAIWIGAECVYALDTGKWVLLWPKVYIGIGVLTAEAL